MRTTVQEPRVSGSRSSGATVGDRVHRLLNLAAALARTNAPAPRSHASASSSASATFIPAGAAEAVFVGTPLGMEVADLSDTECVGWAQDLEALSRFVQAMQVQAAGELGRRKDVGRFNDLGVRGPVELLVQGLRVSAGEASRRLRLARAVIPSMDSFTGEVLPGAHPQLGEAWCAGDISQENALLVASALDDAGRLYQDDRISADTFGDVGELLVNAGREQAPDHVRRISARVLSHLDPDGQKPGGGDLMAKQGLFFRQARRGLIHFDGHMTIPQYEQLMVAIGTATNPNKHTDINTINQPDTTTSADTTDSAPSESGSHDGVEAGAQSGVEAGALSGVEAGALSGVEAGGTAEGQGFLLDQLGGLGHILSASASAEIPAGEGAGYRPPAMLNGSLVGWGWTRRLEDWEIPPRPDGAPPDAIPPRFEGEKWFWLPPAPPAAAAAAVTAAATATATATATAATTGSAAADRDDGPGATEPDRDADWGGLGVGDDTDIDPEAGQTPWLVDGIRIPHPGSGEILAGLDRRDPHATDPASLDRRSYGQKLLDGLLDCVKLAARTGNLPINGGLKTQLFITTTQADLDRTDGAGTLFTTHTGPVALGLFAAELCDIETTTLLYGQGQTILDVGRTQRLFTTAQRKIITARDLGCSFPDCTAPAPWCEAHHIIPWHHGGTTNINNAALLCSYHHTLLHHSNWTMTLTNGTPYFTAPYTLDRTQTPRRNNYHHGLRSS